jgi:hypothetical protein
VEALTCTHGLHQKYKIQGVGFVCIGCDPTWVPVQPDDGPFSLLTHVGTEPMTDADWQDAEA